MRQVQLLGLPSVSPLLLLLLHLCTGAEQRDVMAGGRRGGEEIDKYINAAQPVKICSESQF